MLTAARRITRWKSFSLLEQALGMAVLGERLLGPGEIVAEHDQDVVTPDGRARLGGPAADVLVQELDHPLRYLAGNRATGGSARGKLVQPAAQVAGGLRRPGPG
jgi:hypothetical protein